MQLLQTPLYPLYAKYGAKTVNFGGWELPVQFSGIQKEHRCVREQAGLFDVSHMGEFRITGLEAENFLQYMLTNDVTKMENGQVQYSMMCYPDGGTVDDLLVYKFSPDHYMLVVNAANIEKDLEWLQKHAEGDVQIRDISRETALLALQGPLAPSILQSIVETDLAKIAPFHFKTDVYIDGAAVLVSRTGYTGEDGFELYMPADSACQVWERLLEAGQEYGLCPAGLGARDTLRFEAGLALYGQELSKDITPIEAGLGMFVKVEKDDFVGKEVLQEQKQLGPSRKLVGIEMVGRGIPRTGLRRLCR